MTSSIPLQRFTNRTVIVTGGVSGFGETICRAFAAEGAAVVVAGRNGDSVERVAGSLPQAIAVTVDVTDEDQNKAMADAAVSAVAHTHRCRWWICPYSSSTRCLPSHAQRVPGGQTLHPAYARWWGHREHRVNRRPAPAAEFRRVQRIQRCLAHAHPRIGHRTGATDSGQYG